MKTRFFNPMPLPDAHAGSQSNYSMERSPTTALLFEASHTVVLPVVRLKENLPSTEILSKTAPQAGCSVQE